MKKRTMAAHAATASRARTFLFREGVLAGTLNAQAVGSAPRFTLTDKVAGKTRCLYVTAAMAPKVRRKAAFKFFCWVNSILPGVNGLFRLSLKDRDEENALYACQGVLDVCRRNGWHYVFVFKEGRSPSIFGEAQSILDLAEGQWGKMIHDVRKKKECVVGGVRWAKDVPFGEYRTNVVEIHQMVASDDSGAYYGQFMTDLEVNDARRALEIGTWGRHRWLIESSFKTEKREGEDGFGLEHTFCKDENASRAMHLLMQFAHNVWQVFNSGFLENLSVGCRKVAQGMWGRKICEALHYYDYSTVELETVYLNHEYEDACRSTS